MSPSEVFLNDKLNFIRSGPGSYMSVTETEFYVKFHVYFL